MKKILLCCAAGMSTSLLVQKMQSAAAAENFECEIEAVPFTINEPKILQADVVLLGPQVRFNLKSIKERYPDKPAETIDMMAYGMCDGVKILKQAKRLLGLE
ncbi:MAG: PTS sugar transporter subunit IIB [Erysipelotrichia bacterium]|nr:PTS sugar transporter subunit IIB [Erysipelotrichia bacterium]